MFFSKAKPRGYQKEYERVAREEKARRFSQGVREDVKRDFADPLEQESRRQLAKKRFYGNITPSIKVNAGALQRVKRLGR